MYDVTAIKNYILYLKEKCNLSVTLHANHADTLIMLSDLISFNIHDNSYCIYIKTCREAFQHCCSKKSKIREKSAGGSFEGICYAGVREYVYPVIKNGESIAVICVSGYQCENADSYISAVAQKYGLPFEKLRDIYSSLRETMPPKKEIDTLITPLCDMLELAYLKSQDDNHAKQSFAEKVLQYINENHTQKISSEDICDYFSCSRSYMSREFNRHTGKTIKEYLTELRVKDAKSLLASSNLSITEIAYSVGFWDSNYFSNVFKKAVGISPFAYRKKHKSK